MARKITILPIDIQNFATILTRWSQCESSFFLRQFCRTFAMSEMQFYKRLWKAQKQVLGFDFSEIKKNLRRNRFHRNLIKNQGFKHAEEISIDFQTEDKSKKI